MSGWRRLGVSLFLVIPTLGGAAAQTPPAPKAALPTAAREDPLAQRLCDARDERG